MRELVGATMKAWSRAFAVLLLLTYIGACSKYAYSYYNDKQGSPSDPWPMDTPANLKQQFEFAGGFGRSLERIVPEAARIVPKPAEGELNLKRVIPDERLNVSHDRLRIVRGQADLAHQAIISITGYAASIDLTEMLNKLGYSPALDEWKTFPSQRQFEMAYRAAEYANPGGGNDLLVYAVHELADRLESIRYDGKLNGFLAVLPKQSIKFAEMEASPPSSMFRLSPVDVPLPWGIRETINAIVEYCDPPCAALGGMYGILVNHLSLKPDVAYDILTSSKSISEAFERGFRQLDDLPDAVERTKKIIKILQDTYETARSIAAFSDFRALPTPYILKPKEKEAFYSGLRAGIEGNRVGAQAGHRLELQAPAPAPAPAPPLSLHELIE